jgi:predicted TIM-barrel fold metal-dependent hydrolase
LSREARAVDQDQKLVLFSCDTHISPFAADLRPYCPANYREAFDADARAVEEQRAEAFTSVFEQLIATLGMPAGSRAYERALAATAAPGGHEMRARLRDLDHDGIAASVIFHGTETPEKIPFTPGTTGSSKPFPFNLFGQASVDTDYEMVAAGIHMYNQWLADACSIEPERHVGLAHLPFWDVDRCVQEVEFGARAGLRAVNLPSPRPGMVGYDDPYWEPLWAACDAHGMHLVNHSAAGGAGFCEIGATPLHGALIVMEAQPVARRMIHRLIFGGVFERHPNLKLMVTEQTGEWYPELMHTLDHVFHSYRHVLEPVAPRLPSEYCRENVFVGASFLAPYERKRYESDGLVANVVGGSDYPHAEGAWRPAAGDDEMPMTQLSLRNTFAGADPAVVQAMASENGIRLFNLDRAALAKVAARINAPTMRAVRAPLDTVPDDGSGYAFRY